MSQVGRFGGWLTTGHWPPRAEFHCGVCGETPGTTLFFQVDPSDGAWWGAPLRVTRAVRQSRPIKPTPIFYLGMAMAGAVLGVVLDAWSGQPWWIFALSAVVATALISAISAFAPGNPERGLYGSSPILDAIRPGGRLERLRRREERVFREAPFPLYGLPPSWEGPRLFHHYGAGGRGRKVRTTEAILLHGDPDDDKEQPVLSVESSLTEDPAWDHHLYRDLAESLWHEERPPDDLPAGEALAWFGALDRKIRSRPTPAFTTMEIPVDGEPTRFDYYREGSSWIAHTRREALAITLRARNMDVGEVELVTIDDIEPYAEGSRRTEERLLREAE